MSVFRNCRVFPPPLAEGLPGFWVPLVAWLLMWAARPFLVLWGDTPQAPRHGAAPPGPPGFAHPRWLRVCQRFGPHSWRGCRVGCSSPIFSFVGAHPPCPLGGGCAPSTPSLAEISPFPRREGGQGVRSEKHIPWEGTAPHPPPIAHPRRLRTRQRLGPHSWQGCNLSCEGMKCPRQSPRKGYHNPLGLGLKLQPERYKLPIGLAVVVIPQQRAATSTEVTPKASPAVRVLIYRRWLERSATLT